MYRLSSNVRKSQLLLQLGTTENPALLLHATTTSQKELVAVVLSQTPLVTGLRVVTPQQEMLCSWIQAILILAGAQRTVVCALNFARQAEILLANQQVQANASLFNLKTDVEMDTNSQVKPSGVVKKCLPGTVSQIPHAASRWSPPTTSDTLLILTCKMRTTKFHVASVGTMSKWHMKKSVAARALLETGTHLANAPKQTLSKKMSLSWLDPIHQIPI